MNHQHPRSDISYNTNFNASLLYNHGHFNKSSISSFPAVNTDGLANTAGVNVNTGRVNRHGDGLNMVRKVHKKADNW